jgi:uncharacterized protein YjbI with pentapeptide repeats
MAIEDKLQPPPLSPKPLPPFSPEDEKKAQQELARLRKKEKGASKTRQWFGFKGKTLWDWLQLLAALAIFGTLILTYLQLKSGEATAKQQDELNRQITVDKYREDILQGYFDKMTDLLLTQKIGDAKDQAQAIAQARTLTTLRELDGERKGSLLNFLYTAKLIGFSDNYGMHVHARIIILINANLVGAILSEVTPSSTGLTHTDLTRTVLAGGDFSGADLSNAIIEDANLSNANFTYAVLRGAHFDYADLSGADLRDADLFGANLSFADLRGAFFLTQQQLDQVSSCKGATLPSGLQCHNNP